MFKRKTPSSPPSDSVRQRRRDIYQQNAKTQNYSYYANRRADNSAQSGESVRLRSGTVPPKQHWYAKKTVRLGVTIAATIIVVLGLTFLSTNGSVTVIDNSGNRARDVDAMVYEQVFDELLDSSVLNHNKLTIDTNGIALALQRRHPELESVTVVTPLIGIRPSLYIRVSEPVFALRQGTNVYILSAAGYITGQGTNASLPTVVDETGEPITVAKQLLSSSHVTFMKTVWYQLTEQGMAVETLVLPKAKAFEIDVRLRGKPYYLKFNVIEDALQQSGAAFAVIGQLGEATPKEYIDLRVPGKAYYK